MPITDMPETDMRETDAMIDARRDLEICNACRYCEGICAVFPAMELRREFAVADLTYLANLCHDCRGCYYSCQYAPPHEFGINLPRAFATIRADSYADHAWPQPLSRLFQRNGTILCAATALGIALVLVLTAALQPPGVLTSSHTGPGAFYAVIPFAAMLAVASITFVFALLALGVATYRFWRSTGGGVPTPGAIGKAAADALSLRNLGGGGGDGCNYPEESFSTKRRHLHHAMAGGFLLCFAATCIATIYDHWFGWIAPYPLLSLPVALGSIGGIGMIVGTFGLIVLKVKSDPVPAARAVLGGDYALLFLLLLAAVTGLMLLALRSTGAMGTMLAIHLGSILALFVLLPYSKFVHGLFRSAALLRAAMESSTTEPPTSENGR